MLSLPAVGRSDRLLTVIERILTHLGLSAQPPPRAPARRVELFQAA
ncbi:MAG: hypothetical protein HY525_08380 [Betaproteobacteria bacterium]|nr:hypothetical protein [Betaproteobacteria bacterium]